MKDMLELSVAVLDIDRERKGHLMVLFSDVGDTVEAFELPPDSPQERRVARLADQLNGRHIKESDAAALGISPLGPTPPIEVVDRIIDIAMGFGREVS